MSAVGYDVGGSNHAETTHPPLNGGTCSGDGSSFVFSLHPAKFQLCPASTPSHCAFFDPGYSSQKPPRFVEAKTSFKTPLPPVGRWVAGPKPNDSRMRIF